LLFANSQNNMGRKKDLISNSLANFVFQKPKNPLTKRKDPLSERRAPLSERRAPLSERRAPLSTRKLLCSARIYARNPPRFANLPKMSNLDTKLLEKYFSYFAKNFRMSNLYAKLLEMLRRIKS
jgi:hypothetical protein